MDYSLTGSSAQGILQARILEWVTISFFRVSSQPRNWKPGPTALQDDSLLTELWGKPQLLRVILFIVFWVCEFFGIYVYERYRFVTFLLVMALVLVVGYADLIEHQEMFPLLLFTRSDYKELASLLLMFGNKHLNAEFQRIARRDKKAFFSDQCTWNLCCTSAVSQFTTHTVWPIVKIPKSVFKRGIEDKF